MGRFGESARSGGRIGLVSNEDGMPAFVTDFTDEDLSKRPIAAPYDPWAVPSRCFSVIAPEAAAAILHRGPVSAGGVAEQLRLRPTDLLDLGIIRGIVGEVPTLGSEGGEA